MTTTPGQTDSVADEIAKTAQTFLGSATKGLPDNGKLQVLVEIPGKDAPDFKNTLTRLPGVKGATGEISSAGVAEKISIVVQLTEVK